MADYKYALGIDLGMRNTHAYYLKDGHVKPVKIDGIDSKMPSVLYVGWSQKVYVGRKAVTKAVFNPHNMICSSKKYIGDNKTNKTWTLNGLTFTPTDVATEIMKEVYRRFVLQVGCNKEEKVGAVITVPAYFTDIQVKETENAGIRAGFEIISIEPEPVMATMAVACKDTQSDGRTFLVVDIGGGTFDISLLKANAAAYDYQIVDVCGVHDLNEDTFIEALLYDLKYLVSRQSELNLSSPQAAFLNYCEYNKLMYELREVAWEIKTDLESMEVTTSFRPFLLPDYDFDVEYTQNDFNRSCQGIHKTIFRYINRFIENNEKLQESIDHVILIGGTQYMKNRLTRMFANVSIEDEAIVARGAAMYANVVMNSLN